MEQGDPATSHNRSALVPTVIAVAAIVVGVSLRVVEFLRDRPLWLDEAMLALNIASRSMMQLARPLDYDQTAPLVYLWIERVAVSLTGVSERSLRLLPFIAGVALVPLVWVVARRLAGAATATIATVLVAVSVTLVTFSAEGKQYGVDPLATVLTVWLALRVMARPESRGAWWQLVAGGATCLLLSQPAVFALGGVVIALAIDADARRSPLWRRRLPLAVTCWAIMFVALYLGVYQATATSEYMRAFWEGTFLDPRAPDFLLRLRLFAIAAFASPMLTASLFVPGIVFAIAWIAGVWTLWTRRPAAALLVAAPLVLSAVACALGHYPVMDRLFLFAAPLTLVAYASLLARLVEIAPARVTGAALVAACGALAIAVAPTHVERIRHPVFFAVGKQIILDVDSLSRGEPVYVAARSFPLWVYYTTNWDAPDAARLAWAASIGGAGAPAHNNAPPSGRVRTDALSLLARSYRGRLEMVGMPTGRQYLTSTRSLDASLTPDKLALPLEPDSGWAGIEVTRMAAAARPRLWVFGSHMFALDGAEPGLVAELQRRNVRLVMERRQGTTVAYHVEFPGEP
jgi:hypothetical protein